MGDGVSEGSERVEEGVLMVPDLIKQAMTQCIMIVKARVPDGQGGTTTGYTEGARFDAAITKNKTLEAVRAEKEGVTELYLVTTAKGVGLDYGETFKRLSDGAMFRVTSNSADSETPKAASFAFERVRAERWKMPE